MKRRLTSSDPDRTREAQANLRAHNDGSLRVVAVADTHGRLHPDAELHISALRPDAIVHAGDVGTQAVLKVLGEIAPVLAVRGNVDERGPELPDARLIQVDGAPFSLRVLVTHIALNGTKLLANIVRIAESRGATLVVCGHSHVPFVGRDRGLVVFNPGSAGPRRFHLPIVFGVLELTAQGLELYHVDCETGSRWRP